MGHHQRWRIVGGRLVHGKRSLAEAGHSIIDGQAASRGEPATLEQQGSGTALHRLAVSSGLDVYGPELVTHIANSDQAARRIWESGAEAVAIGVANLVQMFSPEFVIVGGGVVLAGDLLLEPIKKALSRVGPRGLRQPTEVRATELGDDAGLTAAATWAEAFVPEATGHA